MTESTLNGMTRKEVVRAWVRALESGEYKQGREYLCQVRDGGRRYCCLGVLCEVASIPGTELTVTNSDGGTRNVVMFDGMDNGSYYFLPRIIDNFLGIGSLGMLKRSVGVSLANMNDEGESFKRIADTIRQGHVYGLEDAPQLLEGM